VQSKEDEWFGGFGDLRDLCEHHSNDTNVDTAVRLTTTGDIVRLVICMYTVQHARH
jgi:hypothetical protein